MKNKFFVFFVILIFAFSLLVVSCHFAVPNKIEIKTSPTFTVPTGEMEFTLQKYLSVDKIKEMFGGGDSNGGDDGDSDDSGDKSILSVYPYKQNDDDDAFRMLLMMNMDVPLEGLNFDDVLEGKFAADPIKFGYEEDEVTPKTMFTIPDLSKNIDVPKITINYSDLMTNANINENLPIPGTGGQEISFTGNNAASFEVNMCPTLSEGTFSSMTFGQGAKIILTISKVSGAEIAKITKVSIKNGQSIVAEKSGNFDLSSSDQTIDIDVSNKTLNSTFKLVFETTFKNSIPVGTIAGTTNVKVDYGSANIKSINGFKKDEITIPIPSETVQLGDAVFKQASIAQNGGSLSFNIGNLPAGITQESLTFNITQQDDVSYTGFAINQQPVTNGTLDLSGQNINSNDITLAGELKLKANGATINFPTEIAPTASFNLTKFSTLIVDTSSLVDTSALTQNMKFDLSSVGETVSKITFDKIGVKINACNGLPLDITATVKSKFIYDDDATRDKILGGNSTTMSETEFVNSNRTINLTTTKDFDLEFSVGLAGGGISTLTDVEPGTSYKFYGEATPIVDWKEATVNIPEDKAAVSGNMDSIDLSILGDFVGDGIEFCDIRTYGYLQSNIAGDGKLLDNVKLSAIMGASYTEPVSATKKNIDIVGTQGTPGTYGEINFVTMPDFTPDDEGYIVTDLQSTVDFTDPENPKEKEGECSFYTDDFTTILNDSPADMTITYDVKVSGAGGAGLTVQKSALSNLSGESPNISFRLAIDFPVKIKILHDKVLKSEFKDADGGDQFYYPIDVMKMVNKIKGGNDGDDNDGDGVGDDNDGSSSEEKDLFNRTEGGANGILGTVMSFVDNASIDIDYNNTTGLAIDFVMLDGANNELKKQAQFKQGEANTKITFDIDDANYIFDTYPFYPDKMELRIPGKKHEDKIYTLSRNAGLTFNASAVVKTNVDYVYDFATGEGSQLEN